ncbi:MAG: hypothetical protein CL842_12120 [Crocinitomicaceae bacterium]|nr:hypothetical protein [Crocinitomicaceae bacterium]|tara:strand:+ start:13894 stop:14817 length:924 start_codon:yes stop_codon:yes gene_type:complete
MNFNWLTESIENPAVLLQSKSELQELKQRYPYLSSLYVFDAKLEQLESGLDYQDKIKKAAIYASNRSALYEYVIKPNVEEAIANQEKNTTKNAVIDSTTSQSKTEQAQLDVVPERSLTQKEKDEKRALEKEILNHAISASILKESASSPTKSQKDEAEIKETEVLKKPTPEEPKIELDNSMGVLDWLNSSLVKETVHSNTSTSTPVVQKSQLIEKFIKGGEEKIHLTKEVTPTLLQIERPQTEFFSPENMAKMSLAENEDFVTETLAKIYAQQGNIKKAISAYEKLSLKIPEKSNYFALLIQELKEN